jgi:DNA-binding transcriptional LysR family regulator
MKWADRIGRRLKLHDLHVLLTVAELGSMGKAAERLNVSQPSVSKAIADMEHTIGVRLLDRTPKGVETTAYGRALLQRGMGAFDELRQGIKDIEALADPDSGEVRIGCPEAIAAGLMMAAIMRFSAQHPRVLVSVTAANNLSQEYRLLRNRSVDFLVGAPAQPFAQDDLEAEILYEDRSFILCGSQHSLARRRKVAIAELVDQQWLLPRESVFSSYLTQEFDSRGLPLPKLGVRSYSVHQRIGLLTTNRFISAESGSMLRYNAARFPIKVLPVDCAFQSWPVGIVTLKKRTVSPVVQTFMDCVREIAKPLAKINAPLPRSSGPPA